MQPVAHPLRRRPEVQPGHGPAGRRGKVLTVFGTRPEAIKLWPVIRELEARPEPLRVVNVTSGQHRELLDPLLERFGIRVAHDLHVMTPDQTPNQVCQRVLERLERVLQQESPDLVLVQGDTTTALAAALAGFHHSTPVAHVEAGLRSGRADSPFPEEMNRRLISQLAAYHFAPTVRNRDALLAEGVCPEAIHVTGNPVVDALQAILETSRPGPSLGEKLERLESSRLILLTAHRRENHRSLPIYLRTLRDFVRKHTDTVLVFPVHPNPGVRSAAAEILAHEPRVHLLDPLDYPDFIHLLSRAWLVVSDSGGIQEEAPSLGKALLVLRENTERPEVLEAGVGRLVGPDPRRLEHLLEEAYCGGLPSPCGSARNPFGVGDSARRIARVIAEVLGERETSDSCTATSAVHAEAHAPAGLPAGLAARPRHTLGYR